MDSSSEETQSNTLDLCPELEDIEGGFSKQASISYSDIADSTGMSLREAKSKFNF